MFLRHENWHHSPRPVAAYDRDSMSKKRGNWILFGTMEDRLSHISYVIGAKTRNCGTGEIGLELQRISFQVTLPCRFTLLNVVCHSRPRSIAFIMRRPTERGANKVFDLKLKLEFEPMLVPTRDVTPDR